MKPEVEQYISAQGSRVYRIPLSLFPGMHGFTHLIKHREGVSIFDVGSGFGDSNADLEAGMEQIRTIFDDAISWKDIDCVFISHGHIDHFGGLHFIREQTDAPIVVHELERRILTDYENRLNLVAERLEQYLMEAGLSETDQDEVMTLYLLHKQLFSSIEVQASYEELGMRHAGMTFEHVPGHCPGHVIAWLDDILLSGDHILKMTSPHQAPESLSLNMGLEHYLSSLAQVLPRADRVRWTLGGHEGPIDELGARIIEIANVHRERLAEILNILEAPMTLFEISKELFPVTEGYHRLLAIEEAGAHVEYLLLRGYIGFTQDSRRVKRYSRLEQSEPGFPGFIRFDEFRQPVQAAGLPNTT